MSIIIGSRGACPRRAIELIGHTTKSGDDTIGRFGSGTAYAIALALRMGVKVNISSCDEDGPYTMEAWGKIVTVGDRETTRVMWRFRRGSRLIRSWWDEALRAVSPAFSRTTSFSAELGVRDWHGHFPILREFLSNAVDADPEGWKIGHDDSGWEEYKANAAQAGFESVTLVELSSCAELEDILVNFDRYFKVTRPDREKALYSSSKSSVYRPDDWTDQRYIFVRGVRCPLPAKTGPSAIRQYDIPVELSESRHIKSEFDVCWDVAKLWGEIALERPDVAAQFLQDLQKSPSSWEATSCGFDMIFGVAGALGLVFHETYGANATVRGPNEPKVAGSVEFTDGWAAMLARGGAKRSSVTTVTLRETPRARPGGHYATATVVEPSGPDYVVFEMPRTEAHRLMDLLRDTENTDYSFYEALESLLGRDASF